MRVAVIGAGAIGSTFAFHLARAGHEVSVIARGARLARVAEDGAIVTRKGARAEVKALPALEPGDRHDLVLVTVLASQVDAVLPQLAANASPAVMFMFNAFGGLGALRDAVGRERFGWGFPAIVARLVDGALEATVVPRALSLLQITTVGALTDHAPKWLGTWAEAFSRAGIPCVVQPDMESWLRSHAAFMAPLMATGVRAHERGRGVGWVEARELAAAMRAAFALVQSLGNRLTPANVVWLSRMPQWLVGAALWVVSRLAAGRALGANGSDETRWLLGAMLKAAPAPIEALVRVLPDAPGGGPEGASDGARRT